MAKANNQSKEEKKDNQTTEQATGAPASAAPAAAAGNSDGNDKPVIEQPNDQPGDKLADPAAAGADAKILVGGGWELSFRFSELLTAEGVDVTIVDNAMAEAKAAGELPESLQDVVIPHKSLQRYAAEIAVSGIDPNLVEFVVADPTVDPTLKTLNFMRKLQGHGITHFYPRFYAVVEEEPAAE